MKRRLLTCCASVLVLAAFCSTRATAVAPGKGELRTGQSDSTVSLACSENMPAFGQTVTFTATVTASGGSGVPTGSVTFKNGAATLGTTMLTKGSGSYAIPSLAAGGHSITATYSGDGNFAGNASKALMLTVNALPAGADKNGAAFKIAENESPRPQNRLPLAPGDTGMLTTVFGKFVTFKNGNLTLLVSAMEGNEPMLTEFGRITAVNGDPTDTMADNSRALALLFNDIAVGAPIKLETNSRGETAVFILPASSQGNAPVDNSWRYKQQNGEWWYYGPDEKWLVYRNGMWVKYLPTAGTTGNVGIFDRWGNRIPAPGQNRLPVVGDWDGDGKADVQTAKPGNTGPRAPATSGPIPGSPLRRAIGGNR